MDYEKLVKHVLDDGPITAYEVVAYLDYKGIPAEGDHRVYWPYESVVIWDGVSKEVGDLLIKLTLDERLAVVPTHPMTFAYDGVVLTLPLATVLGVKRQHRYKADRWLPVEFRARTSA